MTETVPSEQPSTNYVVEYFYCELQPTSQCEETAPGNQKIIRVNGPDTMQSYSTAFEAAKKEAPNCPIHGTQMIPQLTGLPEDIPPSPSLS